MLAYVRYVFSGLDCTNLHFSYFAAKCYHLFLFSLEVAMVLAAIKLRYGRIQRKFINVIVARFRNCGDLIPEGKVFVKNKAKIASGVGCSERGVVYFRECCLSPIRSNSEIQERE